jgi:hypothetical protein
MVDARLTTGGPASNMGALAHFAVKRIRAAISLSRGDGYDGMPDLFNGMN